MKEFLLLLFLLPIGALVVTTSALQSFHTGAVVTSTPVAIVNGGGSVGISLTPQPTITAGDQTRVQAAIDFAMTWLGGRYSWGGCTRAGIDCSCFVQTVFAHIGISLPRVTWQQIQVARPISASEQRPLDLVFFDATCTNCGPPPTHVGIVLTPGTMIDAGDPVRIEPIYGGHNARYGRVLP